MQTTDTANLTDDSVRAGGVDELRSLRAAVAEGPGDIAALCRFVAHAVERRADRALTAGVEPALAQLDGPLTVRPVAAHLAETLHRLALDAEPRLALELELRRARLLQASASDPFGAATALAAAWTALPDPRVPTAAQSLAPPDATGWEAPLEGLAAVADDGRRVEALKTLASGALEKRRLGRARTFFAALPEQDPDAQTGLRTIADLEEAGARKRRALEAEAEAARSPRERGRVWRAIAEVHREVGEIDAAKEALRTAILSGDEASIVALDQLLAGDGRHEQRRQELEAILRDAPPTLHHPLRRRLFELMREAEATRDEAASVLKAPLPRSEEHAQRALTEARAFEDRGELPFAAARYEDAAGLSTDPATRMLALERGARLFESLVQPQDAERLWRKVRAIDPRSTAALDFYRGYFEAEGEHKRLHQVLSQLHALETDSAARRALAESMARVAEEDLDDIDRAIEAWRLAERDLGADEDPRAIWHHARALCAQAGRWHGWVELLEKEIGYLPAEAVSEKVELLFEMVEVFQDPERLPMPPMVQAIYQRIVALEPRQPVALDKLCSSLEEREQWEDLRDVLRGKIDFAEADEIIPLFQRIAELYLDHIKADSQAIAVLEQLLELDPENIDVVHRLRELYRKRHAAPELYENISFELRMEDDPARRIALLAEQAELAEHRMLKPELAIARWRAVLELDPRHPEALAALPRLHSEQADWSAYVAAQERRIAETTNKAARLPLLFDLGEALYLRLGDLPRAEETFRVIAAAAPTSATARRFLQRIFVQHRKWDELRRFFAPDAQEGRSRGLKAYAQVLEEAIKGAGDDHGLAADALSELACLRRDHLGEPERAAEALGRAIELAPERVDIADALLRDLGPEGAPELRLKALTVLAQHAADTAERRDAWRAIATTRRLTGAPEEAFHAAARAAVLSAELGEAGDVVELLRFAEPVSRWEETLGALEEALARTPASAPLVQASLHRTIGEVAGARLRNAELAIRHLRWVLQLTPGDTAALDELERIYFSRNDFKGLRDVYRTRIQTTPPGSEARLKALRAMASLQEDVFLDSDKAAQHYLELALDGDSSDETIAGLTRTHEAREAWAELAGALEAVLLRMPTPRRRIALHEQLFALYTERLEERVAAIDHARSIIEGTDAVPDAVTRSLESWLGEPLLEREVAPVLEMAYRRLERPDKLIEVLELRRQDATGAELIGILDDLAMLHEGLSGDPGRAFDLLAERLDLDPTDITTWDAQLRLADALNREETLAALWEKALAQDAGWTDALKGQLHWRLGELYHRGLIEIDAALVHVQRALELVSLPVERQQMYEALEVLHRKNADPEAFIATKLRSAEEALSRSVRRSKRIDAARTLAGAMRRFDEGLAIVAALFDEEPGQREVGEAYFELLEKGQRFDTLETAWDRAMEATAEPDWRDTIALTRALALRDRKGEWENAIFALLQLIESEASGLSARMALLDIARAEESAEQRDIILEDLRGFFATQGDDDGLIQTLLVEAEFASPGRPRASVYANAAELAAQRVLRGGREDLVPHALQLYGHALMDLPDDADLLRAATGLAERTRCEAEWAEVLEECAASLPPDTAAPRLHLHLGAALEASQAAERAIAPLTLAAAQAVAGSPLAREALGRLAEAHRAAGDLDAGAEALARLLAQAPEPREAIEAERRLAGLLAELGRRPESVDALRRAVALARELGDAELDEGLREQLDDALHRAGRHEERIEMLLDWAEQAEGAVALIRRAAAALRELEDKARVLPLGLRVGVWERLNAALGGDDDALAELERLYAEAESWPDVATTIEQRADLAADRGDLGSARVHALKRVRLLIDRLDAGDLAVEALLLLIEDDPTDDEAMDLLLALVDDPAAAETAEAALIPTLRGRGETGRLATALERRLDAGRATAAEAAELTELTMTEPRRAWAFAARGFALDPTGSAGARCRELAIAMTASGHEHAPRGPALATMLAGVIRELPDAERRAEEAERCLALLRDANLGDEDSAAPLQRVLLQASPDRADIAATLERWALRHDRREVLAEILAVRARNLDGDRRSLIELERARLLGRLPRQENAAVAAYAEAIEANPANHDAHRERLAILNRQGRDADEAEALALWLRSDPPDEERPALARRLFDAERQRDPSAALALVKAELKREDGERRGWIARLESLLRVPEICGAAFRALEAERSARGDVAALHALYLDLPEGLDRETEVHALTRRYTLEEAHPELGAQPFRTMLLLIPLLEDPRPLIAKMRPMAEDHTRWRELVQALANRVRNRASSPFLVTLAELLSERATRDEATATGARAAWERAIAASPKDPSVRAGFNALLDAIGAHEALVHSLEAHARLLEDPTERARLQLRRAELLGRSLGRTEEAAELAASLYDDALPAELRLAIRALELDLLARREAWDALEEASQRWVDAAANPTEARDLRLALARALLTPKSPKVSDGLDLLEPMLADEADRAAATEVLADFVIVHEAEGQHASRQVIAAVDLLEEASRGHLSPRARVAVGRLRLAAASGSEERRALLITLARAQVELGAHRDAIAHLLDALLIEASDPEALEALETLVEAESLHIEGAEALVTVAEASGDTLFFRRAARIFAGALDEPARAADCYERHVEAAPEDMETWGALVDLYAELGDARSEARALQRLLSSGAAGQDRARLALRLGAVLADALHDVDGAIEAYELDLDATVADATACANLERLYAHLGRDRERADLYDRVANAASQQPDARVRALSKLAQVLETGLSDVPGAVAALERILALDPSNRFALTSLERLCRATGDWERVDALLARQLELPGGADNRLKVHVQRAAIASEERDDPEAAIEHLRAADADAGGGRGPDALIKVLEGLLSAEPAIRGQAARLLGKRYEARQDWLAYLNVLMLQLGADPEETDRVALVRTALDVIDSRLDRDTDGDRGLALLMALLRQSPEEPAIRNALTVRAAGVPARLEKIVAFGQGWLKRSLPGRERAEAEMATFIAGCELALGREDDALRTLERGLRSEALHTDAFNLLVRIHRDAGRVERLRAIHDERLALVPNAARPLAELERCFDLLALPAEGDTEGLAARLEAIVDASRGDRRLVGALLARVHDPASAERAIAALERAWGSEAERHATLTQLEGELETATALERPALLWQLVALARASSDGSRLSRAFQELATAPLLDARFWRELRNAPLSADEAAAVTEVLAARRDAESLSVSRELLLLRARTLAGPGGQPEEATRLLREALSRDPEHRGARRELVRLYGLRGDLAGYIDAATQLQEGAEDRAEARAMWRELLSLAETRGDTDAAITAAEALLALDADDDGTARKLEALLRRAGRLEALAEFLELRAGWLEQPEAAAEVLLALGALRVDSLGDPEGAADAWRDAWALAPHVEAPMRRLVDLAQARGDHGQVGELIAGFAAAVEAPERALSAWLEAARAFLQAGAFTAAVDAARAALAISDEALEAHDLLVEIFGRQQHFKSLAAALEARARAHRDAGERAKGLAQAATIHFDRCGDPESADNLINLALALRPTLPAALLLRARMARAAGEDERAAEVLQSALPHLSDRQRARALFDLARIYAEALDDVGSAMGFLAESLRVEPGVPDVEALYLGHLEEAGRTRDIIEYLAERLGATEGQPGRGAIAMRLATLSVESDPGDSRVNAWLEVAEGDPEVDRGALLTLRAEHALANEAWEAAGTHFAAAIALFEARKESAPLARCWHKLGHAAESRGRRDEAITAYRKAHGLDGRDVPNLLSLGRVLVEAEAWDEAISINQSLLLVRDGLAREQVGWVLTRLALANAAVGDLPRARQYADRLGRSHEGHPGVALVATELDGAS